MRANPSARRSRRSSALPVNGELAEPAPWRLAQRLRDARKLRASVDTSRVAVLDEIDHVRPSDHTGHRVLIVAHQVIVNCFRYIVERLDEKTILAIDREGDVPNCAFTEYRVSDDERCLLLERANHIPPPLAAFGATRAADAPAGPR